MKKLIIATFVLSTSFLSHANEMVVPELELGHWITVSDTSDFIEQALSSVPEESREFARQMMKTKLESASTTEQCITENTLQNFDEQIKNAFGDSRCDMNIQESNENNLAIIMTCPGSVINIKTAFINTKLSESTITTVIDGMPSSTIKAVSKWKSKACLR